MGRHFGEFASHHFGEFASRRFDDETDLVLLNEIFCGTGTHGLDMLQVRHRCRELFLHLQ